MKVTLVIAVCTLAVLLPQMQTTMAKPQPRQFDPPRLPEDLSE